MNMARLNDLPPLVLFEDEHLLVVNKPAGWNTHAPSPLTGEGIYEWLRHREPRWESLAIVHRLDKETSGVLVFSRTALANRSLTRQFTSRSVKKIYLLVTDRPVPRPSLLVRSALVRLGERYISRPPQGGQAQIAETQFRLLWPSRVRVDPSISGIGRIAENFASELPPRWNLLQAEPITGRTHQIRVHAAASGFPIRGDSLYGGTPAERLALYAVELTLSHPATGRELTFIAPPGARDSRPWLELRKAIISPEITSAYRLIHGAADGRTGWYVDRLGNSALSQCARALSPLQTTELQQILQMLSLESAYHKILRRDIGQKTPAQARPQLVLGPGTADELTVRENGLQFQVRFAEGYSVGLFLDQRDNRRRLLTGHIAAGFPLFGSETVKPTVLNTFAYTCGFSVCAAKGGAHTTSIDLSKKYLQWGKTNFKLNELDPAGHDFIYGDVFDWLTRLARRKRSFDVLILDPPTFSQSKESGSFRAARDYRRLVQAALPLLNREGILLACTNAADLRPEDFLRNLKQSISGAARNILQLHYVPQPPDFPVTRDEPAFLKTVWARIK